MKFWTRYLVVLLTAVCFVGCESEEPPAPAPKDVSATSKAETVVSQEPAVVTETEEVSPSEAGTAEESVSEDAPPLKALIVTGQCNRAHNWKVSSPILKQLLEETGLFKVDVAISPPKKGDMSNFKPKFADYKVVVLNYNGDEWPQSTKDAFVKYVKSGGGVVVYHAANNSFPKWKEFNEIIGLGGWGGRDEKSGPMVRFRDGKFVLDTTPGKAGTHGPQHAFQVVNRVRNHPITRGLPERWMHAKDELYSKLRGPATNMSILATAYADPDKRGTGEHEPVLFTVNYGKGRVFHTVLGHVGSKDAPPIAAVDCVGFITTFQRGAEWAATGTVTQPVPDDFPTATKVSIRKFVKKANIEELLKRISGYEYGQSRKPLTEIEEFLRSALNSPEIVTRTEKQFTKLLRSDATLDAKQFICHKLSVIGSEESVPTLAVMLSDPTTADMARYALERIEGEAADEALRKVLPGATGKQKIGIINTLGARGDEKSAGVLAGLIYDDDSQIATAAVAALGRIGNSQAAALLADAAGKTGGKLKTGVLHACLSCADNLATQGNKSKAVEIYSRLYAADNPENIRIGALRGMILSGKQNPDEIIINAIKQAGGPLQAQAIALIDNIKDAEKIKQAADYMPNLPATGRVQLLAALTRSGSSAAGREAAVTATKDQDEEVRIAALKALAVLGDESTVGLLAEIAASSKGPERKVARESLYSMPGAKIDEAIIGAVSSAEPDVKIELIGAIKERRISAGAKTLLITAQDPDGRVRLESWKAMRVVNDANLPELLRLMSKAQSDSDRREAEITVSTVADTLPKHRRALPILEQLASTDDVEATCSLLKVLGKTGGEGGLEMLRGMLDEDDPKFVDAAIRGLAEWPDDEPMDDLLKIARTSDNRTHRILAIRAYLRMIGLDKDRSGEESLTLYRQAMDLAPDTNAKRTVLSGLATVRTLEALKFVAGYLEDDALGSEAAVTVERIASGLIQQGLGRECKPILEKVIALTKDKDARKRIQRMLK